MLDGLLLKMQLKVRWLKQRSYEYYILDEPTVPDEVFDRQYDELLALEKETGIIFSDSPTQNVGYPVADSLAKVEHPAALLSLEKTKSHFMVADFAGDQQLLISLKLDGLTLKIEYENGRLVRGSTRGNGHVGEDITHNLCAISGIPAAIPYYDRLVVTGEAYIRNDDFAEIKESLTDSNGKPYSNSRNLAAGSVRQQDALQCSQRRVSFMPFSILEGLEDYDQIKYSKWHRLRYLKERLGFDVVPHVFWQEKRAPEDFLRLFNQMKTLADHNELPIDGIVVTYNSIPYSKSCGATGHHYKDGIAFKFEDDTYETVLREIQWQPTRGKLVDGEHMNPLAPVAIFDPVVMPDCTVTRASLHNVSIIRGLELAPGCRISISRRNTVIPHVEDNLDRGQGEAELPETCPCCGTETKIKQGKALGVEVGAQNTEDSGTVVLYCPNPNCWASHSASFEHFVSRKAMNIEGLSGATLESFRLQGWLETFIDIYHLDQHRDEIITMDGFGEKSFDRLWAAIEKSRTTTFERFVISVDIPMIGNNASKVLARRFDSDLDKFYQAAVDGFDFATLESFGQTLHENIRTWFSKEENRELWNNLKAEVTIMSANTNTTANTQDNPFKGKTVVVTGTLENYTRAGIDYKLESLGAKAGKSVSSKTDYVLAGEKAGSKLTKARDLGVKIITEAQFEEMIAG